MNDEPPRNWAPSVFGVSVVFGGGAGMSAASAFGLDAGGGFIVGTFLAFLILAVGVLLSRELERLTELRNLIQRLIDEQRIMDPKRRP
jgi:uncharacterized membrane protein YhiD involved in acid resistance